MTARRFQDSAGTVWEVFEVRRASEAPRGVSEGLERGWLTFSSEDGKRRLAPFPPGWENAPPSELEQLCAMARRANATRFRAEPRPSGPSLITQELLAARSDEVARTRGELADDEQGSEHTAEVRAAVRTFAKEARAEHLSAVEAMLRLKAVLGERYDATRSPASHAVSRDLRRVRRWFVEAFYFESER